MMGILRGGYMCQVLRPILHPHQAACPFRTCLRLRRLLNHGQLNNQCRYLLFVLNFALHALIHLNPTFQIVRQHCAKRPVR